MLLFPSYALFFTKGICLRDWFPLGLTSASGSSVRNTGSSRVFPRQPPLQYPHERLVPDTITENERGTDAATKEALTQGFRRRSRRVGRAQRAPPDRP